MHARRGATVEDNMELECKPHAAPPEVKSKQRVCDQYPDEIDLANLAGYAAAMGDCLLSVSDVSRLLGMKPGSIDTMARAGELKSVMVGDRRKFLLSDVKTLLTAIKQSDRWAGRRGG